MTGILGGTFDPPHFGHLVLAMEALEKFSLDGVILVPARTPPHKEGEEVTPFRHRMAMTELAVEDAPELRTGNLEPPGGPSWTVRLLRKLVSGGMDVCFIMGMDSLNDLDNWKEPEEIVGLAKLVAGTRPGFAPRGDGELLRAVETFTIPGVDISSSRLRRRFAEGRNTRYLLPGSVIHYVRENCLYGR